MTLADGQILIQIVIVLLGLYIAFFKSYFKEKGKNIATKEDIEHITEKVEKIRHDLHFLTESRLSLRMEERNALIDYYTCYQRWLNTVAGASPSDVDESDSAGFVKINNEIDRAKFEFDSAKSKLGIFVENDDIYELEKSTIIGALSLQHLVQELMCKVEYIHFEMSIIKSNGNDGALLEKYENKLSEKAKLFKNFYEEKLNQYEELVKSSRLLAKLIHDNIKSLAES